MKLIATTTNWTIKQFNAPPIWWNGVGATNHGNICGPVGHFATGRIPADSAGGTSGNAVEGNAGSMCVATNFGTPPVDMFHLLYNNGILTQDSDFFPLGHPKPPGSLAMAITMIQALGLETNVGSFMVDYQTRNTRSDLGISYTAKIVSDAPYLRFAAMNGSSQNGTAQVGVENGQFKFLTAFAGNNPSQSFGMFAGSNVTTVPMFFASAPSFGQTNAPPANTTTPKTWIPVTNNGVMYLMPGYQ